MLLVYYWPNPQSRVPDENRLEAGVTRTRRDGLITIAPFTGQRYKRKTSFYYNVVRREFRNPMKSLDGTRSLASFKGRSGTKPSLNRTRPSAFGRLLPTTTRNGRPPPRYFRLRTYNTCTRRVARDDRQPEARVQRVRNRRTNGTYCDLSASSTTHRAHVSEENAGDSDYVHTSHEPGRGKKVRQSIAAPARL